MELVIFRLVQECLTNIHRHSGSKTALIRVGREADKIHVEVQDHGKGMSQERLAEVQSQGTGVGIRGMRERVRHVHGELTIESNALGTQDFRYVSSGAIDGRNIPSPVTTPLDFREGENPFVDYGSIIGSDDASWRSISS